MRGFGREFIRDLVDDFVAIVFDLISSTPLYEKYIDYSELYTSIKGSTLLIIINHPKYGRVAIEEIPLNAISSLTIAEDIIRRILSERFYGELIEGFLRFRIVLRLFNSTVYARAKQLNEEKAKLLKECYWYAETLADKILESFIRLDILSGLVLFRLFLEEMVTLCLRFLDLKAGGFRQKVRTLVDNGCMSISNGETLLRIYSQLSSIIHGSHEKIGGSKTIGKVKLSFDVNLAHNCLNFINSTMRQALLLLMNLIRVISLKIKECNT